MPREERRGAGEALGGCWRGVAGGGRRGALTEDALQNDGWTPLLIAAQNGHAEAVKTLLEAKSDVNKAKPNGKTALMNAASFGHPDVAALLLGAGADKTPADEEGRTALTFVQFGFDKGFYSDMSVKARLCAMLQ